MACQPKPWRDNKVRLRVGYRRLLWRDTSLRAVCANQFVIKIIPLKKLASPAVAQRAKAGGADRDRTGDLMNAIHALYQLSYSPKKNFPEYEKRWYYCSLLL